MPVDPNPARTLQIYPEEENITTSLAPPQTLYSTSKAKQSYPPRQLLICKYLSQQLDMIRGALSRPFCRARPSSSPVMHVATIFKETDIGNPAGGVECMSINNALDKMLQSGRACNIFDFNQMLTGILRDKKYRDAIVIYRRFRDEVVPDIYTFNILMNCYCSVAFTGYGFGILAMLMKRGYFPDVVTYTTLIHSLCRAGEWEKAEFLFAQMKREGVAPDVVTYSSVIDGLYKSGNLKEAQVILEEMITNGISPNVVTYNTFIHGLSVGGKWEEAEAMLEEMIRNGISPNVVTYNTFIHGLSIGGKWEEAEAMLEEMIRYGIFPNVVTYNSLIHGLCRTGKLRKAEGVFLKMIVGGATPDLVTYNSIIHVFLNAGKWEEAKSILREMRNNGISPDVITFNYIILGLSKAGKQGDARHMLLEMKRKGIHSTLFTYIILICGLLPVRNFREAGDILNEMMDQGICPNVVIYNKMIHHLFVRGNWEDAVKIYHDMNNNGIFPDVVTCNSMIHGMFLAGKIKEAKSIVYEMKSRGITLDVITFNTLIHGFCNIGHLEEAECIFSHMMEKGVPPDAITYNVLISALIKYGKGVDAYQLLEFMIRRGERFCAIQAVMHMAHQILEGEDEELEEVVDVRPRLNPPLPQNYFGNALDAVQGAPKIYQLGQYFDPCCVMMGSSPKFNMYGNEFRLGKALGIGSGSANKFDGKVCFYPGYEGGGSVDVVLSDNVQLVVSRQLLQTFAQDFGRLLRDAQKASAHHVLAQIQPRVVSFEEQVLIIREKVSELYESEGKWSQAAQMLNGIGLHSSMRLVDDKFKLVKCVQIARLYLEDDDSVNALAFINKASFLVSNSQHEVLNSQYKVCYARILYLKRKFLEAALRYYYAISQIEKRQIGDETIDEDALEQAVSAAVTAAGPQRSRVLATLYKDERSLMLKVYPILQKVYLERILRKPEIDALLLKSSNHIRKLFCQTISMCWTVP
ncbi:unnamed protein product [Rhodiola kirilowii]